MGEEKKYQNLYMSLDAVEVILGQITLLDKSNNEEELDKALPGLLESLGRYTMSGRAYIFAWTSPEHKAFVNILEWCAEGVKPEIDRMQSIPIEKMPNWVHQFEMGEPVISRDWEADRSKMPEEYELFQGQDIQSLIVIPIFAHKKLNGFIGLDNPEQKTSALSLRLLSAVGGHLGSLNENMHMLEELEEKRHKLEHSLEELNKERKLLNALCIDYTSVYYCDLLEDTIEPIKQGKSTNAAVADANLTEKKQCYSFRIQYYYDKFVIQESAPDFVSKLSREHLMEYLSHHSRMAYRFRTKPNLAGQEYFEVHVVRLQDAEGFKVVMGYRYIDDLVEEQDRHRTELENALAAANLNNEIINAISKIYWLIYRMDLRTDTYEEISSGEEMHRLTGKRGNITEVFEEARKTIVAPEHQEMMREFLDTSTLPERLQDTESVGTEYHTTSGTWHLARFIVKKRDENGRVINVLYATREINKQKQQELEYEERLYEVAEEAKRANLAKTDFLRRMSHDIRTPINGIRGVVSIANHYPDDMEKQQECRDKIMEASGFLLDLVNSVLDMNKLESGHIVLEKKPFELPEILRETCNIVKMQGKEHDIPLYIEETVFEHPHLIGSPLHLRQVLQNIATNAVKYNKKGGSITLSGKEVSCDGETAVFRLTCTDTGRGMSKEFQEHAFEPFTQEGNGARTAYMGTGLGLTITKQLVEMMGGTIELESELGIGTKFTVIIPFQINTAYKGPLNTMAEVSAMSMRGIKVLLTEDNELNMEIARFILEKAGMSVTMAWNGKEAVEQYEASKPGQFDAILMDVMMPGMNGLEATRIIRKMDRPDAATIPIFAMTANAFQEDVEQSLEAGMNEHLSKPLEETKVLCAIQKYVTVKE